MRAFTILATCLLTAGVALGECPTVQSLVFQPSSANIRIVALFQGKPVKDAKVDVMFFLNETKPLYTLSTNNKGVAIPPELPAGNYRIEVWTSEGLISNLYLQVPLDGQKAPIVYSLDLGSDLRLRDKPNLEAATRVSASAIRRQFAGVVRDAPGGNVLPGASIEIWKAGTENGGATGEIRADSLGRFSLPLEDGTYVALFRAPGLRERILNFEIASTASSQGVQAPMVVSLDLDWLC